ncbi:unannotated protein [freshwater metagenome]|uniref:Unannotated protein n=1 Tax=freshwater metagenome TaxID=449393 RepID=A0A6J7HW33_9ZZZZ|nr:hypothetical protein [Actinomycetota bacterium]
MTPAVQALRAAPRRTDLPSWTPSPGTVVAALAVASVAAGGLFAVSPMYGVAGMAGVVFAALLFLALTPALGAWVVLAFASGLPGLAGVPAATTVLVAVAWLVTLPARREHVAALRARAPWALVAPWLLFGWMVVTAIWAPDRSVARSELWLVLTAVATVPIITTVADTPRTVRLLLAAYVGGTAMVVVLAVVLGPDSYVAGDHSEGRLEVANFSANLLGAICATALVLVPVLWTRARTRASRAAVLAVGAIVLYGLVGTQSRSGLIALLVAGVAALVICRGRRRTVLRVVLACVVLLGAFVATNPGVVERATADDSTGTGRTELWRAGLQVAEDHPLTGVGIGNFVVVSERYAQQVGTLRFAEVLLEDPKPVHNAIIESVAETGVVGLVLLLGAVGACMTAAARAARRFRRLGLPDLELVAQLVLVAQIAIVTAGMFLPVTYSRQLWMLLAIGPALLGIALRMRAAAPGTTGAPS